MAISACRESLASISVSETKAPPISRSRMDASANDESAATPDSAAPVARSHRTRPAVPLAGERMAVDDISTDVPQRSDQAAARGHSTRGHCDGLGEAAVATPLYAGCREGERQCRELARLSFLHQA